MPKLKDTRKVKRKYNEMVCNVLVYDTEQKCQRTIEGMCIRYTVDYVILRIIKNKIGEQCVYLDHEVVSDLQYIATIDLDALIAAADFVELIGPAEPKVVNRSRR